MVAKRSLAVTVKGAQPAMAVVLICAIASINDDGSDSVAVHPSVLATVSSTVYVIAALRCLAVHS